MKVFEIFKSISGEVAGCPQGSLATFIRFTNCNLFCSFCFGVRPGRRKPRIMTAIKNNKKIMDVVIGDKLITFDDEMSLVETTVKNVLTREVDIWYRIKIEGTEYYVTPEHPFFTNNGLVSAENLKIGDQILHSKYKDKMSFHMLGKRTPMKQKETVEKSKNNTDYKANGLKIADTIKHKKELGIYTPVWDLLTEKQKNNFKKKISIANTGSKNGNYTGHNLNLSYLKKSVKNKKIVECNLCKSNKNLEVHHIDGNIENDDINNLTIICKSCHTSIHKKGYNFWNKRKNKLNDTSREKMKKRLKKVKRNGMEVQAIKFFDRSKFAPSIRPKPLKVYNFTCEPYNSYLIDYMWVHNCDAPEARTDKDALEMSVKEIISLIKGYNLKNVIITGGEPLLQDPTELCKLVNTLNYDLDINISIETNGSILVPTYVLINSTIVMDYKLDQEAKMNIKAFEGLRRKDFIKFVIKNKGDIKKAIQIQKTLVTQAQFAYSPMLPISKNILENPQDLIVTQKIVNSIQNRLINNNLEGIINLQIHKILNVS